jgi:hypothetical protein
MMQSAPPTNRNLGVDAIFFSGIAENPVDMN